MHGFSCFKENDNYIVITYQVRICNSVFLGVALMISVVKFDHGGTEDTKKT